MKRTASAVVAVVGVLVLLLRGLGAVAADAPPPPAPPLRQPVQDGIWIWTRADAQIYAGRGERAAQAMPGVLVLTVDAGARGELVGRRGLSPASVPSAPVAAVIRVEDAVAPRLEEPRRLAGDLDERIRAMRGELEGAGIAVAEVQLDFDVPVRRLDAWADVAGELARGVLSDVPVWVTSIPAHLAETHYGDMFRDRVAGHVQQVFDTGLACNAHEIRLERERLERAAMPYRIGVATFEREREGRRSTEHGCWANATRELRGPSYAGAWVFPAGRPVDDAFFSLRADGR